MATLYPAQLDTNDSLYVAVNGWNTNLTSDIDANTQTIPVKSTAGSPATGAITIKGEAVKYSGKTATSFTGCTRGYDTTANTNHFNNDLVEISPIADHHNALVGAIQAIEAKLGTGTTINGAQLGNGTVSSQKLSSRTSVLTVNSIAGPYYNASFSFTPVSAASTILVMVSFSAYATVNGLYTVNYKLDGGAATFLTKAYYNQTFLHMTLPTAMLQLSGLSVAAHTIAIQQTANLSSDGNDVVQYMVIELAN